MGGAKARAVDEVAQHKRGVGGAAAVVEASLPVRAQALGVCKGVEAAVDNFVEKLGQGGLDLDGAVVATIRLWAGALVKLGEGLNIPGRGVAGAEGAVKRRRQRRRQDVDAPPLAVVPLLPPPSPLK